MSGRVILVFLSSVCLINADSKILGYDSKDVTGNLSKLVDYSNLLEEDKMYTLEQLLNETSIDHENNFENATEIADIADVTENFAPFQNQSGSSLRIIPDGDVIPSGKFPYFVRLAITILPATLLIPAPVEYDIFCGGTLLSETWVLTAAQCVYKAIAIFVTADLAPGAPVNSPGIATIHPGFRKNYLINDIALVRLSAPFTLTAVIYPIKLSKREHELNSVTVTTMGIGPKLDTAPKTPDVISVYPTLRAVDLVQISKAQCNSLTKQIFVEYPPTTSCLSSASNTKGFCVYDAGGPVVYTFPNEVSVSLLGITSQYQNCPSAYPMAYTKIAPYYHWIKSIVKKLLV